MIRRPLRSTLFPDTTLFRSATERQARQVWAALADRMVSVGLRLHPDKTKNVICGHIYRELTFACVSLSFLGNPFRPRESKAEQTWPIFTSFLPAISPLAMKA